MAPKGSFGLVADEGDPASPTDSEGRRSFARSFGGSKSRRSLQDAVGKLKRGSSASAPANSRRSTDVLQGQLDSGLPGAEAPDTGSFQDFLQIPLGFP